jgi:protein gp37
LEEDLLFQRGDPMNLDKNIGWCTHTHNIETGCLNRELGICNVTNCYARQVAENPLYHKVFPYGFEPHFYEERIHQVQKLRKPAIIFMDSMSDTFGSWWTEEQILKVLHIMDSLRGVGWHKYVVLTKNPARMVETLGRYAKTDGVDRLENIYFGTSVTGLYDIREISRLDYLTQVHSMGYKTVLSMEPLLYDPAHLLTYGINWLDWFIIGGQTKPTKIPPVEWILTFCSVPLKMPIFLKDNLGLQHLDKSKMFPADLLPIVQAWGKA